MPHLGIELQVSFACCTGIDGELCGPIHDAACGLQARPKGLHLVREAVGWGGVDVGDERGVPDIFIVTNDMYRILPRFGGPITHIAGAVPFVITLNFGLGGPLDREAWVRERQSEKVQRCLDAWAVQSLHQQAPFFDPHPISPHPPGHPLFSTLPAAPRLQHPHLLPYLTQSSYFCANCFYYKVG